MKAMKKGLGVAAFLMASTAFAGVCDGVSLSGEFQIIPLDGTTAVMGRLPLKDLLGVDSNPLKAEPNADGSVSLAVYEGVIPARLGQKVADLGTIEFAEGEPTCTLIWKENGNSKFFELITASPQGDLILSAFGSPHGMYGVRAPTLIFKKVKPEY